jgi:hypothetical protein
MVKAVDVFLQLFTVDASETGGDKEMGNDLGVKETALWRTS